MKNSYENCEENHSEMEIASYDRIEVEVEVEVEAKVVAEGEADAGGTISEVE